MEVGAGTMCPETFLRVLGPKPYRVAYVQPSRRPADGRYGDNPNRLYKHPQLQVILKPAPEDVIEQYLGSLEAIGIDLRKHDIKFEEDNWEAPTLGAWGIGWQVMLDGLEISQFTYFQQCGGIDLDLVPGGTHLRAGAPDGLSADEGQRIRHRLGRRIQLRGRPVQRRTAVLGLQLRNGRHRDPVAAVRPARRRGEAAGGAVRPKSAEKKRFPVLPAYDQVLKCSNLFNLLDARGAISVTERAGGDPAGAEDGGGGGAGLGGSADAGGSGGSAMSLPFLLEIGTEEIPDWMIPGALENLRLLFERLEIPARRSRALDATPRRLVLRAEGLPDAQPDCRGAHHGSAEIGAGAGRWPASRGSRESRPRTWRCESTPKGEYYASTKRSRAGRRTTFWRESLPGVILGIHLPKTMYWTGKRRPALHPSDSLDRGAAGRRDHAVRIWPACVPAALTSGHRRLGAPRSPGDHRGLRERLRDNYVILSAQERHDRIDEATGSGARARPMPNWSQRSPTSPNSRRRSSGNFDPAYLDPARRSADHGDAASSELLFGDGSRRQARAELCRGDEHFEAIPTVWSSTGNERVLRARFNDARFFWDVDQKKTAGGSRRTTWRTSPSRRSWVSRKRTAHDDAGQGTWAAMPMRCARRCSASATSPPRW